MNIQNINPDNFFLLVELYKNMILQQVTEWPSWESIVHFIVFILYIYIIFYFIQNPV